MDHFALFGLVALLYVTSQVSIVSGRKCHGQWAIHACAGANGKRSGDAANLQNAPEISNPERPKLSLRNFFEQYVHNRPADKDDVTSEEDSSQQQQEDEYANDLLRKQKRSRVSEALWKRLYKKLQEKNRTK